MIMAVDLSAFSCLIRVALYFLDLHTSHVYEGKLPFTDLSISRMDLSLNFFFFAHPGHNSFVYYLFIVAILTY